VSNNQQAGGRILVIGISIRGFDCFFLIKSFVGVQGVVFQKNPLVAEGFDES
jgi:hypothetical protein